MIDAALLAKAASLPTELQAEVVDFVDFLVQKTTRKPAAPAAAVGPMPAQPTPVAQDFSRHSCQPLGEYTSDGSPRLPLVFGAGKHLITYIADDFDAPLEDFKDYM